MPVLELKIFRILFRSGEAARAVPKAGDSRYKQRLLNIPTQSYGEEYVKRYAHRFGAC